MKIPRFDDAHILTIGDAMLDRYWHGGTRRISAEAPIPVVDIDEIEDRPGGAANVALNVATLGARSSLIAATGEDEMAEVLESKLAASGIDCRFLRFTGWPTITKIRVVSMNQQMLRADFERPNDVPVDQVIAALEDMPCDSIVFSDYDKGMLADPVPLIDKARALNKPVLVDPKFKAFTDYAGATLIKPNKLELEKAVGTWTTENDMVDRCRRLMNQVGCEAMLVTRASEGMTLITRDEEESHFPARTREVYDTSGAGDTVISVLAAALASGQTLKDSVALANIAAGIVVSHFGVTSVSGPELRQEVDVDAPADGGKMTRDQLAIAVQVAKSRGEKVVFTNGCFDILHAGHVNYLEDAKQQGDRLIVAVNSDASVKRLKGEARPINTIDRRLTILAGLAAVDWVVPFEEDTPEALLELLQPDVLVKGGDYSVDQVVGADIVRRNGGTVKVLSLVEDCSTSALVEKIRDL